MMRAKKDFAFAYLLLVVLPLFALAGALREGRKLAAPVAVGGLWKMQVRGDGLAALPCGQLLAAAQDAAFTISQSGKIFTLRFTNSALSLARGSIEGTTMKASLSLSPQEEKRVTCQNRGAYFLTATVDSAAKPHLLAGELSLDGCAACTPVEFRAIQQDQDKR